MKQTKLLLYAIAWVALLLTTPTTANANIPPNNDEIWWGYFKETDALLGFGHGQVGHYDCAIQLKGSNEQLVGHNVRAIRFFMQGTDAIKDVKVWVSASLPMTPQYANVVVDVPVENVKERQATEVLLPQPFKVPSTGVYVGYSFTTTKAETYQQQFPVLTNDDEQDEDGAMWMKSNLEWTTWNNFQGMGYGKMAIQVLVEGNYAQNRVKIDDFGDAITVKNDSISVPVTLTNLGTNGISSFDYTISTNDAVEFSRHVELDEPFKAFNSSTTANIVLIADPAIGRQPKTITITKVNNEINEETANNISAGTLITLESAAPHRTVIEEFTATWAPASPRGIAGKKLVKEQYPNNAIWISAHVGTDPMSINDYQSIYQNPGNGLAPSNLFNRKIIGDPYFGTTQPRTGFAMNIDIDKDQKRAAEASVEMNTPQMDKHGLIRLSTDVKFNYSRDDAPYALGYVLLADGLKSEDENWKQTNIFPGWVGTGYFDESDENLNIYASMPNPIPDMTYDDVAIATFGITKGLAETIKAPIVIGTTQTHNYTIELGSNPLAQNLHALKVVALLFNTNTGEIVNADIQPVNVSEEFAANAAVTSDFVEQLALAGKETTIPLTIESSGRTDISSIDVTIAMAGETDKTETIEVNPPLPFGNTRIIEVPLTMPTTVKDYATTLTITKVNGSNNEELSERIASEGTLRALSKAPVHKTFIEEFTGTWCGFCPRGTLGLMLSEERHPGKFVAVAVHGNDIMTIDSYYPILLNVVGFPSAFVNRTFETDPYMGKQTSRFGLGAVIEEESARLTEASIDLYPVYDANTNTVTVNSSTTFYVNADEAPYSIGYILVADGLEGPGSKWLQHNYYASYKNSGQLADDPDIQVLIEADEYLDWPYNHVPIDTKGIVNGIEGSIKAPLVAETPQQHSVVFDLSGNSLVQETDKLKVVGIVFNTKTGEIINAEEAKLGESTGIADAGIRTDDYASSISGASVRYDLQGRMIGGSNTRRGINIIRQADGSMRKVVVK